MPNPFERSLSDWIRIAERRKHQTLRARLAIPDHLRIEGLQLEALAYHLTERCGLVSLGLEGDLLIVGEPNKNGGGIPYRGDSIDFLLASWRLTREEAAMGAVIEVDNGVRR